LRKALSVLSFRLPIILVSSVLIMCTNCFGYISVPSLEPEEKT
jgi:hypothetical protein